MSDIIRIVVITASRFNVSADVTNVAYPIYNKIQNIIPKTIVNPPGWATFGLPFLLTSIPTKPADSSFFMKDGVIM